MHGRTQGLAARGPQVGAPRGARSLLGLAAIALLGLCAVPADAQVIRGRIVSTDTRAPMTDAMVEALDSLRRVIASARSDTSGRFLLIFNDPGQFRIRIRRIGIEPTLTDPLVFAGRDTVDLDLLVDERAALLEQVTVRDERAPPRELNARRLQDARAKGWRIVPPERVEQHKARAYQLDQLLRSVALANVMVTPDCLRSLVTHGCLTVYLDDVYFGTSGFNSINPKDIEFLAVIGPTEALTLYGNRARHGVLMVYTSRYEDRRPRRP